MDHKNLNLIDNIYVREPLEKNNDDGLFFTMIGLEDFIDDQGFPRLNHTDSKNIFAKKYKNINEKYRYMILTNNYRKLFNPISIYGNNTNKESLFLNKNIRSDGKFREVNEVCFDYYITFLRTKNSIWLTKAEREV